MPIVGMPDGTQVQFPDEMPGEQIRSLISQKFPDVANQAPKPTMAQKVLEPITSYPDTYHQMRQEAQGQMAQGVEQLTGGGPAFDPVKDASPPDSAAMRTAKGVGNVALGGIGYVASPINAALRSFVGKPIEENTGIPKEYSEFAAALGIPGVGLTRITTARALTAGDRVVQAGQNLDNIGSTGPVTIPSAVASDSMAKQRAAAAVANVPIAGDPVVKSAAATVKGLAQKATDIAGEYGSASAPATAGEQASSGIKNWITGKSAETSTKFYDRVDALVNPAVKTDLSETRGAAQSILDRRANAAISEQSQAVRRIEEAITTPGGLNYEGLKDLRTYIGELKDKPHLLPADISGKELEKIYGALSKDLASSVRNAGGAQAEQAFNRANHHYRLVSERREALAKIIGADGNVQAEQVFDRLATMAGNSSRADISRLAQARKAMGADDWNEVASAVVAKMGRAEDATGNVIFSPQKFLTSYQDKLSSAGRQLLFRSGGKESIAPYLDDIATISGRFRELQKFSNPSGTGQTVAGAVGLSGLMVEPVTALTAAVGTNVIARVLARPATVAPAANWVKKYEIALRAPSPANVAQLTLASHNLANTVNAQFGSSLSVQDFLRAIQSPARVTDEEYEAITSRILSPVPIRGEQHRALPLKSAAESDEPSVPRIPSQQ